MIPSTVQEVADALAAQRYIADRSLAVTIHLALQLGRPLFLEGEAGVGKTEVAKVLSAVLDEPLIRLQCYEGLDAGHAIYEWDYARQMLAIRLIEARGEGAGAGISDIMSREYLVARPLLEAVEMSAGGARPVLLIDELDRADEEFEAYLLELLSDFQVTIPEVGDGGRRGAAGGGDHVQPHPGDTRRPQTPLPLPLDRLPHLRTGGGDRYQQGARHRRGPGRGAG